MYEGFTLALIASQDEYSGENLIPCVVAISFARQPQLFDPPVLNLPPATDRTTPQSHLQIHRVCMPDPCGVSESRSTTVQRSKTFPDKSILGCGIIFIFLLMVGIEPSVVNSNARATLFIIQRSP